MTLPTVVNYDRKTFKRLTAVLAQWSGGLKMLGIPGLGFGTGLDTAIERRQRKIENKMKAGLRHSWTPWISLKYLFIY